MKYLFTSVAQIFFFPGHGMLEGEDTAPMAQSGVALWNKSLLGFKTVASYEANQQGEEQLISVCCTSCVRSCSSRVSANYDRS